MPGLLQRKRNRQHFPVEIGDNQKAWVRPLKMTELDRGDAIKKELRQSFYIGLGLVDEKGEIEIPQEKDEPDEAYAQRVKKTLDDLDFDIPTISRIDTAIANVIAGDPVDLKKIRVRLRSKICPQARHRHRTLGLVEPKVRTHSL